MYTRNKRFLCVEEQYPGEKWLDFYQHTDEAYQQWFAKEGEFKRPGLAECEQALETYMPEFVQVWKDLIKLTKANDAQARMLSLYCPSPYVSGCSQAVWQRYSPVLVRNYDYSPALLEGRIQKSKWFDTEVIASTDCMWGALDGMNEHGLSVSLAFGGKDIVGKGFGIPLILKYVLEFCKTTREAIAVLQRIPTNMAYNITIVDGLFDVATVELSPIEEPNVLPIPLAVNHQGDLDLSSYAMFSNSYERREAIIDRLYDPLVSIESFIDAFAYAPLFSSNYENNFGTLYTAVYNPSLKAIEYRWPNQRRLYQSFENFSEEELWVSY